MEIHGKLGLNVKYPLILRGKINPTHFDRASRHGVTAEECWQMFAISITAMRSGNALIVNIRSPHDLIIIATIHFMHDRRIWCVFVCCASSAMFYILLIKSFNSFSQYL